MTPEIILVVDDEAPARYALTRVFEQDYRVLEAATVADARAALAAERPSVVLLDYNLPGEDGMTLLRELAGSGDGPAIIMVTAHGSERLAVEAMKYGAYDYLAKPYDIDELRLVIGRALERQELRVEVRGLRERLAAEGQFGRMIGNSAAMRRVFESAARVADSELAVLLAGESGTGKDLLAQEIHARSRRAKNRFVALNCAALPESLVESELFGYEKGAFTGAIAPREGKFEQAHRGTLFLDEIGDMDIVTQGKILRASESAVVERLGGTRSVPADVRLVSATNKDLQEGIRQGKFREDLYFRLAAVVIELPPLRARRDDVPLLVGRMWQDLACKYQREAPELTREAMARLEDAPWPGNVRQLRNTVEKLFVLARNGQVSGEDVASGLGPRGGAQASSDALAAEDYREAQRLFEIEYLTRKLREHGGNVSRTAASIGLARQSLQEKIRVLGLER